MSHIKAVMAGMEMLGWDVVPAQWQESLAARRAFLDQKYAEADSEGLNQVELQGYLKEIRQLERRRPERVHFTSTGVVFGDRARLWRSAWWQLSHIKIITAGWQLLGLKWLHRWGIAGRVINIPMPPGAAKHVAEMADVILERNPFQSTVEIVDEAPELFSAR